MVSERDAEAANASFELRGAFMYQAGRAGNQLFLVIPTAQLPVVRRHLVARSKCRQWASLDEFMSQADTHAHSRAQTYSRPVEIRAVDAALGFDGTGQSTFSVHRTPKGQYRLRSGITKKGGLEGWGRQRLAQGQAALKLTYTVAATGAANAPDQILLVADSPPVLEPWQASAAQLERCEASVSEETREAWSRVRARQGQVAFRNSLLAACGGRCVISHCDCDAALEAAHIVPYREGGPSSATNGLLLRADLHVLFDVFLLTVCPETLRVEIAPSLAGSHYQWLHGVEIALPVTGDWAPDRGSLAEHQRQAKAYWETGAAAEEQP